MESKSTIKIIFSPAQPQYIVSLYFKGTLVRLIFVLCEHLFGATTTLPIYVTAIRRNNGQQHLSMTHTRNNRERKGVEAYYNKGKSETIMSRTP
jgi:hypothetical protein